MPDAESRSKLIHLWELDFDVLLGSATEAVHHTMGKIVLVGDHSVGKSALGHRLIHGAFKPQTSTHGQRFWVFPALNYRRFNNSYPGTLRPESGIVGQTR